MTCNGCVNGGQVVELEPCRSNPSASVGQILLFRQWMERTKVPGVRVVYVQQAIPLTELSAACTALLRDHCVFSVANPQRKVHSFATIRDPNEKSVVHTETKRIRHELSHEETDLAVVNRGACFPPRSGGC